MITAANLESEKQLSIRIFNYYLDRLIALWQVAERNTDQPRNDCFMTKFLMKAMNSLSIINGEVYLGTNLAGEVFYKNLRDEIREYLTSDIKEEVYESLDTKSATIPVQPPIVIIHSDTTHGWVSWTITIASDAPSTVALPFNIAVADVNSLMVTVNDQDPDSLKAADEEGCHIIGSTLYWHNYYDLKTGDKMVIKYDKIA